MTVLYRLDATAPEAAAQFGASAGADLWSGGHIGPGQLAPVLTAGREAIAGPGRAAAGDAGGCAARGALGALSRQPVLELPFPAMAGQ